MNIIELALVNFFKPIPENPIIIAYSGGVDSQVLLVALAKLKQQRQLPNAIVVCHVNHGLSPDADAWQMFAQQQCKRLSLPFISDKLHLKKQAQQSLEAIARDARYKVLVQASTEPAIIVTGHHLNDQAETFLLALKRGSGLKGLSAMQASLPFAQHTLARPLLSISRTDIVAYANQQQLSWIEDESNTDERFDRNFLRHQILPTLNERWPSINKTIARSAEHCLEAQQLLDELAQQDLADCQHSSYQLSVAKLNVLSEPRLKNLLRYFLSRHHFLMPSRQQLMQICQQLNAEADKSPVIQLAACCIRRYKTALYLTPIYQDLSLWQQSLDLVILANEKPLNIFLPDELGVLSFSSLLVQKQDINHWQALIKKPQKNQLVTIRFSHENPSCLPQYRQHSRPLKKVLQELAIPPWQRKRLPFIYYDDELVAVAGQFVCQAYVGDNESSAFAISWHGELPF
ncbi:tRNA lysidine(34) synthetase TilS [Colwellia sp. C1TZA3]|uniref:tRNA lysidine(34) synthetase TilS n=1 Tax=Colwellia sp. C1TZA3 TaxID=2508879 RepID=UPI0011B98D1C|nr:tRNA lysidine(34) synthetase TilS [Colwellia sp. C1TZA3]TWX73872.1 tRNA lysidine(34) synthetase TilS [Colwellia sp. C1TZA3]